MNTNRPRLQVVNPTHDQKREENRASVVSGRKFHLFKTGTEAYQFTEGKHFFRLLAQPEGAENSWYLTLPYLYLNPTQTPQFSGYFPMTNEQEKILAEVRSMLYRHDQFGNRMRKQAQPNGVDLNTKYRTVFLGFAVNDPALDVRPIVLPSNGYTNPSQTGRLQAGTQITGFMYETDFQGNPRYGNIVDEANGKIICVEVKGQNERREYIPSVDATLSIADAKYDRVIAGVQAFENIVAYSDWTTFMEVLRARLPEDMFLFVAPRIQNKIRSIDTSAAEYVTSELEVLRSAGTTMPASVVAPAPVATAAVVPAVSTVAPTVPPVSGSNSRKTPEIYEQYGFKDMETFTSAIAQDPSILTRKVVS